MMIHCLVSLLHTTILGRFFDTLLTFEMCLFHQVSIFLIMVSLIGDPCVMLARVISVDLPLFDVHNYNFQFY